MSNILKFVPIRISENDGINSFIKKLQISSDDFYYNDNIEKRVLSFCSSKFNLKYSEYKSPAKFIIISFDFYDDSYLQEFINSNYYHIKGLINVVIKIVKLCYFY